MAYEVLARKWRPTVFQDVIGQEHITETLINAIMTDRLAHAYLFSGARGVGKTSVARILAKAINCLEGDKGNPCNRCASCLEIAKGSSVDVQEIDGASNRGIDEIRELRENIKYMPSISRFRVYIIDEVHMLTLQAFNALLKTLEEPPSHVKFIFATTEPHKVPVTILSRCQRFDFKRIPPLLIVEQLEKITAEENIQIRRSGLVIIAREAEGSMRDAESLLDQVISYAGEKVEDKDIREILGIIDREIIFEASKAIIEGSAQKCLEIVERIYNYGYDIKEFYRDLMDQFRNLIISLIAPQNNPLDMTDEDMDELAAQVEKAGMQRLQQSLNILIAREEALRFTSHPRLVMETIMVKLCQIGDLLSFDDLFKKIEALEKRLTQSSASPGLKSADNIDVPDSAPETEEKQDEHDREEAQGKGEWGNFLNYLSSKNKAMFNVLKEWRLRDFDGKALEIIRGNSPFSAGYLDDPERLDRLTGYCQKFFNRDIEIRISGQNLKETADTDTRPKKYNKLPHPVQEVLDVFNGEIMEEASGGKGKRERKKGNREVMK